MNNKWVVRTPTHAHTNTKFLFFSALMCELVTASERFSRRLQIPKGCQTPLCQGVSFSCAAMTNMCEYAMSWNGNTLRRQQELQFKIPSSVETAGPLSCAEELTQAVQVHLPTTFISLPLSLSPLTAHALFSVHEAIA